MKLTVSTTGFKELDKALAEIEKTSTAKAVMRRALIKAAQPMAAAADAKKPDDKTDGKTKIRVGVSTTLSQRQKKLHKRLAKSDKAAVEVYVGAAPHPVAVHQEFGTAPHKAGGKFKGAMHPGHAPQPFMRPAWDAEAMPTLDRIKSNMWAEIEKTAKRAAAKAARAAKG